MEEINLKQLKKDLLEVYQTYLENPKDETNKLKAQSIYLNYQNAEEILDNDLVEAIRPLIHMGLNLKLVPSNEEIEKIINNLRN